MINNLNELINNINNKINYDKNIINFKEIINEYNGIDWKQYIDLENNVSYKKRKVFFNDNFELSIITWLPKIKSKIHNHPENGCLLKVLSGYIVEEKYSNDLIITDKLLLKKDEIGYINNNIGLHNIYNPNDNITVTLHLYSPGIYKTDFF